MQETWVRSLGWEDPLEKGMATHSNILAWRIPWTVWGHKESDSSERLSLWLLADVSPWMFPPGLRHLCHLFTCWISGHTVLVTLGESWELRKMPWSQS